LRVEIAAHLAATRGLLTDPDRIVVTAGTQQALRVAADLLLDPGDLAWVENPGYIAGRGALLAAGAVPVPGPSDADGMGVAAGARGWVAGPAAGRSTPGGRAAGVAGLGGARRGGGAGGRLRLGVPLGGQAAAATGDARLRRSGDLLRHLQQDFGAGVAHRLR